MTENMHSLLGKYFSGEASVQEKEEVRQWASSTEENKAEFNLLEELWKVSGHEKPLQFDTGNAWTAIDARLHPAAKNKTSIIRMAVAVAASLILIAGLWWFLAPGTEMKTVIATTEAEEVLLEDGSKIYLRKGSSLQFPAKFAKNSRRVSLEGEAFFDISRDPDRPFTIRAAEAGVEVLGTSFSVITGKDKVELIVKSGRVRFSELDNESNTVVVTAGEKAVLSGEAISKQLNADENFNAWQSKQLVFKNTPLAQVVQSLNQYYKAEIKFNHADSSQLSSAKLTASFSNQTLASVLEELSFITSYHIQKQNETNYEISIK